MHMMREQQSTNFRMVYMDQSGCTHLFKIHNLLKTRLELLKHANRTHVLLRFHIPNTLATIAIMMLWSWGMPKHINARVIHIIIIATIIANPLTMLGKQLRLAIIVASVVTLNQIADLSSDNSVLTQMVEAILSSLLGDVQNCHLQSSWQILLKS